MPLLKRKPYNLETPPRDLRPDESVFQVRHTKEIFRDYEEYLSHMNLYRRRLWTCKVTGKQNLTYEEALVSERKATEKVQHFPKEFMGPVLSMVQFSPLRIDELVDRIYKEFKDRFVVHEEALGKTAESLCPCKILKVLQHVNKEDYHYEVNWLDEHGKRFGTSTEPAVNLTRKKHPFTRALLKAFIREAAASGPARNSTWLVKNKLARKYKIPVDLPERGDVSQEQKQRDGMDEHKIVKVEVIGNGGQKISKRRKRDDDSSVDKVTLAGSTLRVMDTKNSKRIKTLKTDTNIDDKPTSKGKKIVEKNAAMDDKPPRSVKKIVKKEIVTTAPPPPSIKYPIEDTLVKPCPDDLHFTTRPLPSTDFILPMECLGNLLMVWDFCTSFSKALHLSPFSLEEFEKSLDYQEGNSPLIGEVLFALIRTILSDAVLREEFVKKRKRKSEVSLTTWKDDLSDLLQLISLDKFGPYLPSIRQGCYRQLNTALKLQILQELVDRSLHSSIIRTQLDENIGERQALSAKKREEEVEGVKRRKQGQLKQLPNGASDGVLEANGKGRDSEIAEEGNFGADKDHDHMVEKAVVKDEIEEDGQAIGWKTKGKRKLERNHSPGSTNGSLKKDDPLDIGTVSKSRLAYLRQKEALKQAEEKEKKRSEENRVLQEKKKGQADAPAEHKSQEQMTVDNQKRQEHLDREMEKRSIRTSPLGKDCDYNVYWFFSREGRLFVENKDSSKWGYYSAKEEVDELLGSFNPKGVRERSLQKQMEKHYTKISNGLLRRSKEMAQKIAMEEVAVRRSIRVRSAPRLPAFLAYVNKLRPS